jgi:protein phosphatase 1H
MGTDGLWDVTSNEKVAKLCTKTFQYFPINEEDAQSLSSNDTDSSARSTDRSCKLNFKYRYISAAQDLVMFARGKSKENNGRNWKTAEDRPATVDDISVFVIPLKGYQDAHLQWKTKITSNSQ